MSHRQFFGRLGVSQASHRRILLTSVSALAVLMAGAPAQARNILATGGGGSAAAHATASAITSAQQAAAATQQSMNSLSRATQAIQAMQAAQSAARNLALAGPNNLGADPNHPGLQLPDVPDGLNAGGLMPDSGLTAAGVANTVTTWVNANTPTQTSGNGRTNVTIQQTAPQALLNWSTFNVGKATTVNFNQQGNAGWIALNRISDPSGTPSQILGQIKADGQVLLINQNGVIFGGSSQINVHTLIASTRDLDPTVSGSNYKLFLQNGLFQSSVAPTGFVGSRAAIFNTPGSQGTGAITVQPGAVIDSTGSLNSTGDGGYVALIGAGVTNAGTIATQNGQIILAADRSVSLVTPSLGAVGVKTALQVGAGGGVVTNDVNALLVSNDGAVTLAGGAINQRGGIMATTSVTRPGSISLSTVCQQGVTCASGASGNIVLGASSLTTILPDETSGTLPTATANSSVTVNGSLFAAPYFQAILQPQITIQAVGSVDVQGNGVGGAVIKAPSAALTIAAGVGAGPAVGGAGTILLEPGSSIDLSGLAGVTLPMSINQISILVTAAEVADTPLARNLIGKTVTIDARLSGTRADGFHWVGSPILDAAGYVGLIPQSIDQILTAGGSFQSSGKNFIQQPGAAINVSGGYVQYLGGFINTARLIGADGHLYDIGSANPDIAYAGVAGRFTVNHPHWGVTEVYASPLLAGGHYEPGYIAGASAGSIGVTALTPILGGDLVGSVVVGDRQHALAGSANLASSDQMPTGASLSVSFASPGPGIANPYSVVLAPQADAAADPYGLVAGGFSFATAPAWSPVLANGVFPVFSDLLSNASLGSISIKGAKQLGMPADATLVVRPGGSITLDGVATIDGVLSAPAGKISLTGFTYAVNTPQRPPTPAVVIGPDAVLDVHGLWVNDTNLLPDQLQGPAFVNGGTVSIATLAASDGPSQGPGPFIDVTQSIVLAPGSIVDVSGGGYVGTTGKLKTGSDGLPVGKGGSVTLTTYAGGFTSTPGVSSQGSFAGYNVLPQGTNPDGSVNHPNQANVLLGGNIYAQGFDGGGTLTLQVPTVVIDGAAGQVTSYLSSATAGALAGQSGASAAGIAVSDAKAGQLVLPPSFFIGGFSQYALTDTYGGTAVTAGTQVVLQQVNALPTGRAVQMPTGALVRSFASVGLLPDGLRKPAGLTLNSGSNILIDRGARIVADAQAAISLGLSAIAAANNATVATTVLGSIVAPAGTINISGSEVRIGSTAVLDVGGTFVPNPLVTAYSTGTVLGGGTIALTASNGNLVTEAGAQFDLQGAAVSAESNLIQLPQGGLAPRLVGQAAWSNGGNLRLSGTNIYFAGAVDAAGGAPLATGGIFTISGGAAIVVEPAGLVAANLPAVGAASTPGAFIGADTLSNSGFDSVTLTAGGAIAFGGSINVTIPGALTLSAGNGSFALLPAGTGLLPPGVNPADPTTFAPTGCGTPCSFSIGGATVNLNAGYVRIVGRGTGNLAFPNLADGTLNVTARWIDLQRGIALHNVANANFTSAGAIRLLPDNYGSIGGVDGRSTFGGAMVVPGNLTLRAAEIYPVSNTDFLLMSTGTSASSSTITILQNGRATAPLSAGGEIVLDAQTIVQDGTLWAPLGSIVLGVQNLSQLPAAATQFLSKFAVYPGPFTPTQNVTLGPGSLTSVSTAGLDIPDGFTVDGTTWYQGTPGSNNVVPVLTAPPTKSISLFGANVATQPGAVLDLSGGGDIYAAEYVPGTGGTRNVLTTYQQNLATGAYTPTYADGRQVYALVPTYQAKVAAYDPGFANTPYYSGLAIPPGSSPNTLPSDNALAPGMLVTIAAGSGIQAGSYTLLPGMYATLPGAYRVVQTASNVNPAAARSATAADGSNYVVGTLSNALTGARSSQSALFQIQSNAVWTKSSKINITSGTSFFRNQALAAGHTPPPLPIDGGVLTLAASNSLSLAGTNLFGPGTSDLAPGLLGAGGRVQISAANILILASDQAVPPADCRVGSGPGCTGSANYLVLDADQISRLGAASVLIGGSAQVVKGVESITASAVNLEVATDAAHQLTGPELLLVSQAGGRGVVVGAGSVVRAVGAVPGGTGRDITFGANPVAQYDSSGKLTGYTAGISGDGSLLRVSNGTTVNATRFFVPGQYTGPGAPPSGSTPQGTFSVGSGAVIDGGNALTLDTSGSGTLASDAILKARNYDIAGSVINIGGGSSGIVLNSTVLANFNDAVSVRLRSASVINLYDINGLQIGDPAHPIGTLTFDSAGLYGQGGGSTINATNIDLINSRGATGVGIGGAGGTLTLNALGTITEDAGAKSLGGFSQINWNAGHAVLFSGAGSIDSGPAAAASLTFDVGAISVGSGGTGYTSVPTVAIAGNGGSGATATASLGVTRIAVSAGGSGYSNGDLVTVSGPGGTGFTGTAIVDSTGAITGVNIGAAGAGFTGAITSVSVTSAAGTGANLAASLGVVGVSVTNAGAGFTGIPTLAFSGGGGTGATAQVLAAVTGITLTNPGDGYLGVPTVTIAGGGGSGATATANAVAGGIVTGLTLNNGGSGYASVPTVTFSGGGGANMLLSAPAIVVNGGATQSLATNGNVILATGAGTKPASVATNIGGALAITAASIADSATIQALSGNLSLTAFNGNVVLGAGASIDASGSHIAILDVVQDTPGGNVRLTSNTGNVTINPNASVSVAAKGRGFAGSLSIQAPNGVVALNGALDGSAAFKDLGGSFALQAGGLDPSSSLPLTTFTSSFAVRLGTGDIRIDAGQTLLANKVLLVTDNGSVIVNGTIDASGPSGGQIALYGAGVTANGVTTGGGVMIGGSAVLNASYAADDPRDPAYANGTSTLVQTGGTITLGTTGMPGAGINATYGYQNVPTSGSITVAAGAVLDVSGGPGGPNINNAGGSVIIRAPILANNSVNVDFRGAVRGVVDAHGNPIGKGVVLNAYAAWSTTDISTGAHHFDGIIDPAGWFDANGNPLSGTDQNGNPILAPTPQSPLQTGQLFQITTPFADHVNFYQSTLASFVQNFSLANPSLANSSLNVHMRPEIDLVNPSLAINNGNITVASNWNLGAGSLDTSGHVSLVYRTTNGAEPGVLTLLARNNVNINATITDGFFVSYDPGQGASDASSLYNSETNSSLYSTYLSMFSGGTLQYDSSGLTNWISALGSSWPSLGLTAPANPVAPNGAFFGLSQSAYDALALQFTLKRPDVISGSANVIDQYNRYYAQYLTLFRAYEQELIAVNLNGVNPGNGVTVSGGIVLSYADFVALETAATGGNPPPFDPSTVSIPSAPTTANQYYNLKTGLGSISFDPTTGFASTTATDYATLWTAYLFNVVNLNLQDNSGGSNPLPQVVVNNFGPGVKPTLANVPGLDYTAGVTAAIAVTPPAPPPAYTILQPGYVPSGNPPHPADLIANNPAVYTVPGVGSVNVYNTTSAAQLMSAAVSAQGSFSYIIVAGAAFNANNTLSVDPNAVIPVSSLSPTVTGNVTIDGHTSYSDVLPANRLNLTINIPTLVRTGTGSITIAAAGNVEFLDLVTPGAVYTAGAAAATPANFNAPTVPAGYTGNPNGLVSTPAWATGGGAVTVTAGGSIIGIEMPADDANGSQTGVPNGPTGQMWSDWYVHYGLSNGSTTPFAGCAAAACQTAAWINYATFFQGFGALGGGNMTLSAGADIVDVGASLPETLVVGGGFTAADPPQATYYGGGNLRVTAGGNLLSSDFLVGRGTGLIQVGGVVQATASNPLNQGKPTKGITVNGSGSITGSYALPLLLAVQDGYVTLNARGSVTLGNVYDPASLPLDAAVQTDSKYLPGSNGVSNSIWSNLFTSYGQSSGISLTSITGDVTALTVAPASIAGLFVHNASVRSSNNATSTTVGLMLPATFDLTALSGGISNAMNNGGGSVGNANLVPYPTQTGNDTGTISLVAAGSINLGPGFAMPDLSTQTTQYVGASINNTDYANYISPLGVPQANLTLALHANDPAPVFIAAGQDIYAVNVDTNFPASLTLIKPAVIEAGNNIYAGIAPGGGVATTGNGTPLENFKFIGQNNNPADITSIAAGNDLVGGSYALYGPGTLLLQTGHDMAPSGIATLGNGSNAAGTFGASLRPYLPTQGAEIDLLFGVKPGINYAAAISQYIDPAHAGTGGIDLLAGIATMLGQPRDQAWITFAGLPPVRQHLLIDRAFLDFLTQVGTDYKTPSSAYQGQYGRAYTAIATLFPAGYGYTDNTSAGGVSGAARTIPTGSLNIAGSVLETQMGGDINIIGPGGGITVGHTSLDTLNPSQEGILTLAGGGIRAYTDGSILVNQSRIMTQQGGDINLFSANGDISAGEGPKTYVSDPPVSLICEVNGYCYLNPQGLVTGAGIGALVTLPGQDPSKSNVTLIAPRGTVDAGAAGIRVAGNLNIVALHVLNAFNVQVGGTTTGLPTSVAPNIGALTAASTASGAAAAAAAETARRARNRPAQQDLPSIITVEVLGYGGSTVDELQRREDDRHKKPGQESLRQDPNSAVQVLGAGILSEQSRQYLTANERSKLQNR